MKTQDHEIHQRKITGYFSEADLHELLKSKMSEKLNFEITDKTNIKIIISTKDRPGTAGTMPYAEITMINPINN